MRQRHDTFRRWSLRLASLTVVGLFLGATDANAQWLNRSTMTFSKPVMVPGATLAPGTYVFELHDLKPTLHSIKIWNENESEVITIAQAIPARRDPTEREDTTVLEFTTPTADAVPAIKSWFYPGTRYGHEFIYPEKQARQMAETTKTKVLSEDPPQGDADGGVIVFDEAGQRTPYKADAELEQLWIVFTEKQRKEMKGTDETKDETDSDR